MILGSRREVAIRLYDSWGRQYHTNAVFYLVRGQNILILDNINASFHDYFYNTCCGFNVSPLSSPKKNQNKNKTQIYMIAIEKSLFQKLRVCLVKEFE